MPNYEVQISLATVSRLTADYSTNSWTVIADDDSFALGSVPAFVAFYETIVNGFSNLTAIDKHVWKVYRRADPPPRVPIGQGEWSFSVAPTGNPLPTEVAICLSFQGDPQSGINQARRRGRVYIGPLDVSQMGSDGRPSTAAVANLVAAGLDLKQESDLSAGWSWGVFSPTSNGAVVVQNGWVDNEFDTQRRRGRDATSRGTF